MVTSGYPRLKVRNVVRYINRQKTARGHVHLMDVAPLGQFAMLPICSCSIFTKGFEQLLANLHLLVRLLHIHA